MRNHFMQALRERVADTFRENSYCAISVCHPERSSWFAKRSSYAVEGPYSLDSPYRLKAFYPHSELAPYEYAPTNSRNPALIGGK
jgi:hypothetical protein